MQRHIQPDTIPRSNAERLHRLQDIILELGIFGFEPAFGEEMIWGGEIGGEVRG